MSNTFPPDSTVVISDDARGGRADGVPEVDRLKYAAILRRIAGTAYSRSDEVAEDPTRRLRRRGRRRGSASRCAGAGPVARQPHSCSPRRGGAAGLSRSARPPGSATREERGSRGIVDGRDRGGKMRERGCGSLRRGSCRPAAPLVLVAKSTRHEKRDSAGSTRLTASRAWSRDARAGHPVQAPPAPKRATQSHRTYRSPRTRFSRTRSSRTYRTCCSRTRSSRTRSSYSLQNNRATSAGLAPSLNSDFSIRSVLTVRCAASILATRDWLEPRRSAASSCVNPRCSRRCRRPVARASLTSTNRRSSVDSARRSPASPTVQPARSSVRRLSGRTANSLR